VSAPGDYDNGEIGGMIGRENRSTRRKPVSVPLCPPQTPHDARTRTRTAVGSQRLTAELRHGQLNICYVSVEVVVTNKYFTSVVGFEALTAVVMKSTTSWDIMSYSPLKVNLRFGGTYRLHLQDRIS
jgi:hypothetical protein